MQTLFDHSIDVSQIVLTETKKEFDGAFTLVVFPFTKALRKKPEDIGEAIGNHLKNNGSGIIQDYNVVKGFLNFVMPDGFWFEVFTQLRDADNFNIAPSDGSKVLVEYSSPNTNKPLHLGHIRNILLGWSTCRILDSVGHEVIKTKIVNDRGIAICKSMLAWKLDAEAKTPETAGVKGDHLVGDYYVAFERLFQEEYKLWQTSTEGLAAYAGRKNEAESEASFFKSYKNQYFNKYSALDEKVRGLWNTMNGWVYDGWEETYDQLGVSFDFKNYESETYLLGKDIIEAGLSKEVFFRQEDGSVWVDLEDKGLDKKILLRSDGTSVYMTQDLGTARKRYEEVGAEKMIYVVGDEQNYHFQVLFETLKKLEEPYSEGLFHLSYGMVDLPTGKMKGREGTIVDADELIAEVIGEVKASAVERGELVDLSEGERGEIYKKIGMAALKFFLLKVGAKKRMVFDPKESVDMQGQTGPYIQNAYVRIRSILRKTSADDLKTASLYKSLESAEIDLLQTLMTYGESVNKAASDYEPSFVATYAYELAKKFHRFYHDVRILSAETEEARAFRLLLCQQVSKVLKHSMFLIGIDMPEQM
ncbi:UNVERIFIED_CONTAM: hypothetical protein GTU68_042595 [Idotea baltica]|nr:hypothetical protein [Idotea baltica]